MRQTERKKVRKQAEEADEVDFSPLNDVFARSVRRPVEPGVWRSLMIAAVIGMGMGLFLWYFKPSPRSAEAAPFAAPKLMNVEPVPASLSNKTDLFQLPAWNDTAVAPDREKR